MGSRIPHLVNSMSVKLATNNEVHDSKHLQVILVDKLYHDEKSGW